MYHIDRGTVKMSNGTEDLQMVLFQVEKHGTRGVVYRITLAGGLYISTNSACQLNGCMYKKENSPYPLPCTKFNSKWIKNLNIKLITLNQLGGRVGDRVAFIGTGKGFLTRTLIAQALRPTINKLNIIKQKNFCTAKDTIIWRKWQHTEWAKILTNYISNRRLVSKIYNES